MEPINGIFEIVKKTKMPPNITNSDYQEALLT